MPIAAEVHNPHAIRIVHFCLLLQYEHVIDALCLGKKSLYFDFFYLLIHTYYYKVLVFFVTAER